MNYLYEGKKRINYYDLDMSGKIKLSALLRMVHVAAEENANDIGIGFEVLSKLNISFVLQRFGVKVIRMPSYNETVTIRTWPESIARGTFLRKGDMYDENGNKIMEWASLWILFDIKNRKILKPSALPVLLPNLEGYGVILIPQKINIPKDINEWGKNHSRHKKTVRYAEVDTNIHMNNSIYGDLIGNALYPSEESLKQVPVWKEIHINYLGETRLGEEIDIETQYHGNEYLIVGTAPGRLSFVSSVKV